MSENNQKVNAEETVQVDQNVETVAETKKGFFTWIRSHKTELILAQNSEHVFLKGRSINQTR